MYLQHISVFGFRGADTHRDVPLDHRTILFGPNGSGKTTLLQAVTWAIYGKYPLLSGTIFTDEDALVNDFIEEGKADVRLTLSDGTVIHRTRKKQGSTTRGTNPVTISSDAIDPQGIDPQSAIDDLIGLNLDEFSASIHLHQETIREFLTTTPEERSALVDRMIGTHLLRTLIKVIDPKIPDTAITKAESEIQAIDRQLGCMLDLV
jgi:exonuclease SbcC